MSSDVPGRDADLPAWAADLSSALDEKMGLELLKVTPTTVMGRMPVEGNTQPAGLWHGGASCVLAETLASVAATDHARGLGKVAVGIEINASHHRSVASGWVSGTAHAVNLGETIATYEVVLHDDRKHRICTARVTCFLRHAG